MDILIADEIGNRLFSIQVKTRSTIGGDGGWHMTDKHERIVGKHLYYVFVDLGKPLGCNPDYYIIPADIVAKVVYETHKAWERNPGMGGRQRSQTNKMRRILPDYSKNYTAEPPQYTAGWLTPYLNAWHYFDRK